MTVERISIELTNQCSKKCSFCYNHSHPEGKTTWKSDELINFIQDCAITGTSSVSFGGGEPLEYSPLFTILKKLQGKIFRSVTTNGLLLKGELLEKLVSAAPDKVHISIHFPENISEVDRVIKQVRQLSLLGIKSGVNLLVCRSNLSAAFQAAQKLHDAGVENDRIVYLPMRGANTPTAKQIAQVAGNKPFQSMTCLQFCHASPRFCSIAWDKTVAWCSYTTARRPLKALNAQALEQALQDLSLVFCGEDE